MKSVANQMKKHKKGNHCKLWQDLKKMEREREKNININNQSIIKYNDVGQKYKNQGIEKGKKTLLQISMSHKKPNKQ